MMPPSEKNQAFLLGVITTVVPKLWPKNQSNILTYIMTYNMPELRYPGTLPSPSYLPKGLGITFLSRLL